MWIYEYKKWPDFTWDNKVIIPKLNEVRISQTYLFGKMTELGFELKNEAGLNVISEDIVQSWAIEGEKLNTDEVRSSVARQLGINMAGLVKINRDVDGIVEMMLDATQNFNKRLTKTRLFNWHAALFPTGRSGMYKIEVGKWRTLKAGAMQVVSGPVGREKVHFVAPSADKLPREMSAFLNWLHNENKIDSIIKAGVAHLWFVTLHPFADGNGRIGRTIADMALARAENNSQRLYSLSSQIALKRKEYYNTLEKQQRHSPDITLWLSWFLDCLQGAIKNSQQQVGGVVFKSQFWQKANKLAINQRQKRVLNKMLANNFQGFMNTGKYAKLAKCSTDTALRDIQDLKAKKLLKQNKSGGRSTSYRLTDRV